jgi:pimeloyl-ACP methyl ester carboxylesterase
MRALAMVVAPFVALIVALGAWPAATVGADLEPSGVAASAVRDCASLTARDFASLTDAPTQLVAARVVEAAGNTPAHCRARGYVAPNTGIELQLPLAAWNGKFFHAGCTGSCGFEFDSIWSTECAYPLRKGYACIVTDLGHRSGTSDGLWAYRNLDARVDFGYRATHRATVAGKAVTAAFYGRIPTRAYFMGCSTGGRQGLLAAQRFPNDFDGIIAGAPVLREGGTSMNFLWNLRTLADSAGRPVVSPEQLAELQRAATEHGDLRDGLRDGVIGGDPRRMGFDPAVLACGRSRSEHCLTPSQLDAVQRVYAGPVNSSGRALDYGGGPAPGSERAWVGFLPGVDGRAPSERSGVDTTRFIMSDWGAAFGFRDFDFDRDPPRFAELEMLYAASNPDLRAFAARGGRLLAYHGWADPIVTPGATADYYDMAERVMGGREATQRFFRLFMVPGMGHCFGGAGPFAIDYLSALENWVERDVAPDQLTGAKLRGTHAGPSMIRSFPRDAAEIEFTRPILPYPREYRR